jgi:EutQ-like cupin domain
VVTGDDGSQCTFRAGDAFVSPAGFLGTWEIIEPAKKLYANYEVITRQARDGGWSSWPLGQAGRFPQCGILSALGPRCPLRRCS